jgi:hypothetical protein
VTINTAANQVANPRLDIGRTRQSADRLVRRRAGVVEAVGASQNYMVTYDFGAPIQAARASATKRTARGLFIAAEIDTHPLRAQYIENFYGFGAYNRVALHVLKFNNA